MYFCLKLTLKEWFKKTYYPIRFNRKNKMIYVYQVSGNVLSISWNKVFFTYAKGKGVFPEWGIDGHILAEDKKTVLQTFSLGYYGSRRELSGYWEFIRCYMEEDVVKELAETIIMCPPIADRKEGYKFGLLYSFRLCSRFDWIRFIVLPMILLESVSRYIAMRTSKIPQWTKEVEKACLISPNDNVDVDVDVDVSYKNNIPDLWRLHSLTKS
ncbi:DUF6708 domain-containing protein [Xenorhabdus bharatensis]|uniref:DUF6708 domain-containing protein n=1 Tax=Xenorhabdus bharatensis TaxID=3136256 RepID=UPI0030F38F86